ncbi:GNAT family N-acetyltransferase [Streptomyces sp. CBMA123]|uniref:GNAT family N-acetyltransferase n=1 Tax=Streptomyces sp. CBMA123 TaxID=1896313 RepID=UPI001661C734|nr:GNAT family N-acetyltransferase [Streptomyces sp. CBMA123]MBD0694507.1 GNAT family N-acetyltransferase [Streptomyces sp. CBMA123]
MRITNADTPRAATGDDVGAIAGVFARAFGDDPMMCWFFPDDATRPAALDGYFSTLLTRQYLPHGVCERTEHAAALWVGPEAQEKAVPDEGTIRELSGLLGDRTGWFRHCAEAAAANAPQEAHWYLAVIGADPAAQGRGQGAALLRSGLARADAAGLPVYLESSKQENLGLYRHFGFEVEEEVRLPANGPTLWAMRRGPRS